MEPAPAAKLILRLLDARRRGARFADAWPDALDEALAQLEGEELDDWREAFDATADAWRAAYERVRGPGMPLVHVDLDDEAPTVVSGMTLVA